MLLYKKLLLMTFGTTYVEREALQVRFFLPRALSFDDGRQGSRLSEKGGDSSRRTGDASLSTNIA